MNPYVALVGAGLGAALLVISSHNPQHWSEVGAPMTVLPACIAFLGAAGLYRATPPSGAQVTQQLSSTVTSGADGEKIEAARTITETKPVT